MIGKGWVGGGGEWVGSRKLVIASNRSVWSQTSLEGLRDISLTQG